MAAGDKNLQALATFLLQIAWPIAAIGGAIQLTASDPNIPLGLLLLLFAYPVSYLLIDRWAKILPGILACGVLNGIVAIISGGFPGTSVKVSRIELVGATALLALGAFLALPLATRKLQMFDRIALLCASTFLLFSLVLSHSQLILICLTAVSIALTFLKYRLSPGRR